MPTIACLHTIQSNVAVFDEALLALGLTGVELRHTVRADLLAAAEQAGGLTAEIKGHTQAALQAASEGADAVLLTCSTLGPSADDMPQGMPLPVLRVDTALARAAVQGGGKVTVLCAVETTMAPTRALFEKAAGATGAQITLALVPHAWDAFKAGDNERYLTLIAQSADAAAAAGADHVALAQASMAGAAQRVAGPMRPSSSPAAGLQAAAHACAKGAGTAATTAA